MKEYQVETIVEALCANMISDKEQLRDISSIGLKTVIAELPQAPGGFSGNICKRITGRLTTAIERVQNFILFITNTKEFCVYFVLLGSFMFQLFMLLTYYKSIYSDLIFILFYSVIFKAGFYFLKVYNAHIFYFCCF